MQIVCQARLFWIYSISAFPTSEVSLMYCLSDLAVWRESLRRQRRWRWESSSTPPGGKVGQRGQQQRTVRTADNSASRYQPSHPGKKTTKALLGSAETKTEEEAEEKKHLIQTIWKLEKGRRGGEGVLKGLRFKSDELRCCLLRQVWSVTSFLLSSTSSNSITHLLPCIHCLFI